MADTKQLISTVIGAYRVREEDGSEYVLAWGINNTNVVQGWLEPRDKEECNFDFRVESGPLQVLTPAAAISRLSPNVICEFIYVHGKNGAVRAE